MAKITESCVVRVTGWVRWQCRRMGVVRWHEQEDVAQEVLLRLVVEARHFDPSRIPWERFVWQRVRWALRDYLRRRSRDREQTETDSEWQLKRLCGGSEESPTLAGLAVTRLLERVQSSKGSKPGTSRRS